jgi:hypothetical protein
VAEIDEKQRFLRTLLGKGADRFPFFDLEPAGDTLERWRNEGLPSDRSAAEFFGLERHHSAGLVLRSHPYFHPAPDLLDDADAFDRHYSFDDPGRFADDLAARGRRLAAQGRVVTIDAWGGGLLQMLGVHDWKSLSAAMYALIERPARVAELVDRTSDFFCACLERVLPLVAVDYATFYEPIASNRGPVVSPAMFERFALPGYRKVLALLERHGVGLRFLCSTGGDLSSLLPMLLESGINGLWISNIQSEKVRYSELRRAYGTQIALIGGINSGALAVSPEAIRSTVQQTVSALLPSGRYLPCLDDRPRKNVPFVHYRFYRQCLAEIAGAG